MTSITPRAEILRVFALLATMATVALPARAGEELAGRIDALVDAPQFKHAHWGLLVVDLESGATLYERSADKLFAPASTTKLFSTAAALDALGPDYRFETPIHARGDVDQEGRLQGDLILVATGDLSMGGRTDERGRIAFVDSDHTYSGFSRSADLTPQNPLAGLDELARQVAAANIKRVAGDVLVDDRLFESAEGTGSGPGRLTPIMINDNVIDIKITPTAAGMPAKIEWRPQTAAVRVDAQVSTASPADETRVQLAATGDGVLIVRGLIASGAKPLVRIHEVPDAANFARSLLIEALRRADVAVDASSLVPNNRNQLPTGREIAAMRRVAVLRSPPFSESIKLVLKVSHNLHASTLPLLVAAHHGEHTLAAGLKRQHEFLARVGVDVDTISFGGGAGGDRADYISPRAAVQLLRVMSKRPDFDKYREALPILGVDGTLATAVGSGSPARGNVQAKTGTLVWNNVMNGNYLLNKALAGYATTPDKKPVAFAVFVNQVLIDDAEGRERIGQLLGKIAETICATP